MPIRRRIAKLRRAPITAYNAAELLGYYDFFSFEAAGASKERAELLRREAWETHRDDLLAYWIWGEQPGCVVEHAGYLARVKRGGPGTRPWAWWRYDAPNSSVSVIDDEDESLTAPPWRDDVPPGPERKICGGLPTVMGPRWAEVGESMRFESEAAYLLRHNLLLPRERAALTESDFAPRSYWEDDESDSEDDEDSISPTFGGSQQQEPNDSRHDPHTERQTHDAP